MKFSQEILNGISVIRAEPDLEKRLEKLQKLNDSLPKDIRLAIPSLVTNAYVRKALDIIEDKITLSSSNGATNRSQA